MDHIAKCMKTIDKCLDELDKRPPFLTCADQSSDLSISSDPCDRNLQKILEQQSIIRTLIETDSRILCLRNSIEEDKHTIEQLRKETARICLDSVKEKQELQEAQSREIEKFQMQQLKSITVDHRRHLDILELRKHELVVIKRETEDEEKNRETHLENLRNNLEKQLQNRMLAKQSSSGFIPSSGGITDELFNPASLELDTIDEYAPYGSAINSRGSKTTAGGRGGTRGKRRRAAKN